MHGPRPTSGQAGNAAAITATRGAAEKAGGAAFGPEQPARRYETKPRAKLTSGAPINPNFIGASEPEPTRNRG